MSPQPSSLSSRDMTPESVAQLKALIKDVRVAMITAALPDGSLHCRPMTVLQVDPAGHFWFYCTRSAGNRMLDQVNISLVDAGDANYVCVSGVADLVTDAEMIRALWTPLAKPWFPDGPDSPDLALLRVTPHHVEYWDAADNGLWRGLALLASVVRAKPVGLGEHGVLLNQEPRQTTL